MRARNIKPGFFKNEYLSECSDKARLLFLGLWCYSDREGKFEWRPKKIKAEIFPYENVKIEALLEELNKNNFIFKYDGFGLVINFQNHQNPHPHEAKSKIPFPDENIEYNQCHGMSITLQEMSVTCNADIMIPDIMIPDITEKEKVFFYGEFKNVKLREGEYEKLISRCKENIVMDKIEALSGGIKSKGYRYKDHYATLLNWLRKDGNLQDIQGLKSKITCPDCKSEMKDTELKNGCCPACERKIK